MIGPNGKEHDMRDVWQYRTPDGAKVAVYAPDGPGERFTMGVQSPTDELELRVLVPVEQMIGCLDWLAGRILNMDPPMTADQVKATADQAAAALAHLGMPVDEIKADVETMREAARGNAALREATVTMYAELTELALRLPGLLRELLGGAYDDRLAAAERRADEAEHDASEFETRWKETEEAAQKEIARLTAELAAAERDNGRPTEVDL